MLDGKWPGDHPAEASEKGRNRLLKLYRPKVAKAVASESSEGSKLLEKSGHVERLSFKAQLGGQVRPIFKEDDRFIIWGPASVEVVDNEGDRVSAEALEDALPQLLKRARLSVEHSDQLVGDILERFETDEPVTIEIDGETYKRDTFPTAVLELESQPPALYVAGEVWDDSRFAREMRERIEAGEIDSYSISGEALVTKTSVEGGQLVDDILEMDLSAVTLCEQGMNQRAKFAVVAKDESGGSTASPLGIRAVAKSAVDKMSEINDREELISTFEETLEGYGVVSVNQMEAYVENRLQKELESEEVDDEDEDEEEMIADAFDEDPHSYGLDDLQEVLPADVWEIVRAYLADPEENPVDDLESPEADAEGEEMEKAMPPALRNVYERVQSPGPVSKAAGPSYSGGNMGEVPTSEMLLKSVYDRLGGSEMVEKSDPKSVSETVLDDMYDRGL